MATKKEAAAAARTAILKMAKAWEKPETIHHAIKAYTTVIKSNPESKEADEAREAIMKIAQTWEKDKELYSALDLYKKLLFPQE